MPSKNSFPRRSFLKLGALSATSVLAPRSLTRRALGHSRSTAGRTLVLLQLSGGNDGLNTVVPYGDDAYREARGKLALAKKEVLKLENGIGLHADLMGFKELFDNGRLAVIEGAGYPDPIRSHFLSMDIWHGADPSGRHVGSGWIARLIDQAFADDDDPNLIVALGPRVPFSCDGGQHRAVTLTSPRAYRIYGQRDQIDTLDSAISSQEVSQRAREFLRKAYQDARSSSEAVQAATETYRPAVDYGTRELARNLKTVASLIAADLPTRVYAVEQGGFDTHSAQEGRHGRLMRGLSEDVCAFLQDLEAHGVSDRVLVLAFSEFGRRVQANGSGGTDHGTAGPMFALISPQ